MSRTTRQLSEAIRHDEDALAYMHSSQSQQEFFNDREVQNVAEKLVRDYNTLAMQLLREGIASHPTSRLIVNVLMFLWALADDFEQSKLYLDRAVQESFPADGEAAN